MKCLIKAWCNVPSLLKVMRYVCKCKAPQNYSAIHFYFFPHFLVPYARCAKQPIGSIVKCFVSGCLTSQDDTTQIPSLWMLPMNIQQIKLYRLIVITELNT